VELARRAREVEEPVDGLKGIINAEIFQLRQENRIPLEALTPLMTIARRFERVSDQASNICEEVIYMVTGEYQKHVGGEVWRMVFLDDHNACRSQMAEAIANSLAQPQFVFASAGLDPKPVDPGTLAFLREKQMDPGHVVSRSVDQVPNLEFAQVIVALSPEARRAFPKGSKAVCLDWSLEDPSLVQGSPQQKQDAYRKAYNFLHEHISELCEAVAGDRID